MFASLDPDPLPRGADANAREKHFKFKVRGSPHAWLRRHRAALLEFRDALSASYDRLPVPPSLLVKKYLIKHPDARGR